MAITDLYLSQLALSVASQLEVVDRLRFAVTEQQAESGNHNHQEALQAELDRFTDIANHLESALDKLAA
jgi:uncharacterized coiled-coil protein SlyX